VYSNLQVSIYDAEKISRRSAVYLKSASNVRQTLQISGLNGSRLAPRWRTASQWRGLVFARPHFEARARITDTVADAGFPFIRSTSSIAALIAFLNSRDPPLRRLSNRRVTR
jgi:hypothetical protein